LIDSSASTAERAKRSSRATTIPPRLAALAALQRLLEHRSLQLGARLIDLLPPLHDLDLVQLRPLLNLLPLHLRRDERLTLATSAPADPDVAVRRLYSAHVRRLSDLLDVRKHPDGNNVEALYRDVGNIGHGESAALH
jgi:hypothetical protein